MKHVLRPMSLFSNFKCSSHCQSTIQYRAIVSIDTGKILLEGADNPGIVHTMTSALAKHGLSIDKMHTDQEIAPQGGTVLFRMNGTVSAAAPLAAGFDVEKIRADLESIGDSLNCDVSLEDP